MTLVEFRDNVIHRGSQVQTIFSSETGFLIQHSLKPFSDMTIWSEEEKQPNNLVPLFLALLYRSSQDTVRMKTSVQQ
jgi:hypothetical protein